MFLFTTLDVGTGSLNYAGDQLAKKHYVPAGSVLENLRVVLADSICLSMPIRLAEFLALPN